jgi:hypothetical protein
MAGQIPYAAVQRDAKFFLEFTVPRTQRSA